MCLWVGGVFIRNPAHPRAYTHKHIKKKKRKKHDTTWNRISPSGPKTNTWTLWHSRVPRARNDPEQGFWQDCRLVSLSPSLPLSLSPSLPPSLPVSLTSSVSLYLACACACVFSYSGPKPRIESLTPINSETNFCDLE